MAFDLTSADSNQLMVTFRCDADQLQDYIDRCSEAAKEEYLRMILGQRVFTRGSDIREWRLFLLIKYVFDGRLPSERAISGLFQTSTTQSRALLRAVMSKYQYELQESVNRTLGQTLRNAQQKKEGDPWSVTVDSENIIEALNRELAAIDGTLPPISKKRGSVIAYEIMNSSYQKLRDRYNRWISQ